MKFNCPNCGGPAVQGFSFDTIYCDANCDKPSAIARPSNGRYYTICDCTTGEPILNYWTDDLDGVIRWALNYHNTTSEIDIVIVEPPKDYDWFNDTWGCSNWSRAWTAAISAKEIGRIKYPYAIRG